MRAVTIPTYGLQPQTRPVPQALGNPCQVRHPTHQPNNLKYQGTLHSTLNLNTLGNISTRNNTASNNTVIDPQCSTPPATITLPHLYTTLSNNNTNNNSSRDNPNHSNNDRLVTPKANNNPNNKQLVPKPNLHPRYWS